MFALVVLTATLPGLAFAGEARPAQMSDSELDNVAAGLSFAGAYIPDLNSPKGQRLLQMINEHPEQITSDPRFQKQIEVIRANKDQISAQLQTTTVPAEVFNKVPKENLAKLLPPDLRPLLDQVRVR
jgi:hypothetical protein